MILTAREFLEQYGEAERQVRRLKNEYEKELQLIDSLGSGGDGTPRGSAISRTTETKALRLAAALSEWERAKEDALEIRQEVFRVVHKVPGVAGDVLYKRYIELMQWEDVADAVGYSPSRVYDLHREGLRIVNSVVNRSQE